VVFQIDFGSSDMRNVLVTLTAVAVVAVGPAAAQTAKALLLAADNVIGASSSVRSGIGAKFGNSKTRLSYD